MPGTSESEFSAERETEREREIFREREREKRERERERERELQDHFTLIKESDRRENISLLHTVKKKQGHS